MKKRIIAVTAAFLCLTSGLAGCGDTSAIDELVEEKSAETEADTSEPQESGEDALSYFLDTSETEAVPELVRSSEGALADPESYTVPEPDGEFDIDLTEMSSSIVYATVYDMIYKPDSYLGKSVKMEGPFAYYKDEETGEEYFAVIIKDATACCSQGIEFVVAGDLDYPGDYPALDEEITVTGIFDYYTEDYMLYCRLDNAEIVL